jgi:hypothetical protein
MYSVSYEVFKKGTDHVEYMTLIGEPDDTLKGYVRRVRMDDDVFYRGSECKWVFIREGEYVEFNEEGMTWVIGILIHLGYNIIKCKVKRILFLFNST